MRVLLRIWLWLSRCWQHSWMILLLGSFGLILSGCESLMGPDQPHFVNMKGKNPNVYDSATYQTDVAGFEGAMARGDLVLAKSIRSKVVWSTINDVDYSYFVFRREFYLHREQFETFADMAKLGMTSAATALGGSVVLDAAVTALQGSQLAVDKNFFRDKATEAIFTTMDALRASRMALIQQKLMLEPQDYGVYEAYNDAIALFNAGTVPTAMQEITAQAGTAKSTAEKNAESATTNRVLLSLPPATRTLLDNKKKIGDAVDAVLANLAANKANVRAFLGDLPTPVVLPADASDTTLSAALTKVVRDIRTDSDATKGLELMKTHHLIKP